MPPKVDKALAAKLKKKAGRDKYNAKLKNRTPQEMKKRQDEMYPNGEKKCVACKVMHKLSDYGANVGSASGLADSCKTANKQRCPIKKKARRTEYNSKLKNRTPEEIKKCQAVMYPDGLKKCVACKVMHQLSDYGNNVYTASGLADSCKIASVAQSLEVRARLYTSRTEAELTAARLEVGFEKICSRCKEIVPTSNFWYSTSTCDGYDYACVECHVGDQKDIVDLRNSQKAKGCSTCGWKGPPCALDFAHLNRNEKLRSAITGRTINPGAIHQLEKLRAELAKCKVLCGNCHRVETEIEQKSNLSDSKSAALAREVKSKGMEISNAEKLLRGSCMDCNLRVIKDLPYSAFDFDHRDPTTKLGNISQMGKNIPGMIEEMKKCDLRCCRCHRIRTWLSRVRPASGAVNHRQNKNPEAGYDPEMSLFSTPLSEFSSDTDSDPESPSSNKRPPPTNPAFDLSQKRALNKRPSPANPSIDLSQKRVKE